MFDKAAIEALQLGSAITQANTAMVDAFVEPKTPLALPEGYKLHDMERFFPQRRRARGKMETNSLSSFAAYVKEHKEDGCTVFVDAARMTATAVLNLGTPSEPGHADNRATLVQERTAAFAALIAIANGMPRTQRDIAEFLEDWRDAIQCFNDDDQITLPQALAAVREITIESARKVESTEKQLSASKSAFESVQATAKTPIPTLIYFRCVPYKDISERLFVLRLGVATGGDKIGINLRIQQSEVHNEQIAQELCDRVRDAFSGEVIGNGHIHVVVGSYSKSE